MRRQATATRVARALRSPVSTIRRRFDPRHPIRSFRIAQFRRHDWRRFTGHIEDLASLQPYQPLWGVGEQPLNPTRTMQRWRAMEPHMPTSGAALDIGCLNGWFTFAMADRGLVSLGVDATPRDIQIPRLLSLHHNAERAAFTRLTVTPQTAKSLPTVDVVVCLSVFHHLVRQYGLAVATETMEILARRTRQTIFFETGQSNETEMKWAPETLSFMGADPASWVEEFVRSLGFERVERLAMIPSDGGGADRALVVGTRIRP